jgi:hypothetical protein
MPLDIELTYLLNLARNMGAKSGSHKPQGAEYLGWNRHLEYCNDGMGNLLKVSDEHLMPEMRWEISNAAQQQNVQIYFRHCWLRQQFKVKTDLWRTRRPRMSGRMQDIDCVRSCCREYFVPRLTKCKERSRI